MSFAIIPNKVPIASIEASIESLRHKGRGVFHKKPVEKLSYIRTILWPVRHFEISYSPKGKDSQDNLTAVRNFMFGNFSMSFVAEALKNDGGRKALRFIFSREKQYTLQDLVQINAPPPVIPTQDPSKVYNLLFKYYTDYKQDLEKQLDQTIQDMEPIYAEAEKYQKRLEIVREQIAKFSGDKKSPEFHNMRSNRSEYQKQVKKLRKQADTAISAKEKPLKQFIRKWNRGRRRFLGLKNNDVINNIGVVGTFYYQYWVARLDSTSSTRYIVIDKNNTQVRKLQNMLNFDSKLRDELDSTLQFKIFKAETISCFFCGEPISKTDVTCPHCSKDAIKCSVCKLPISHDDQIATCPKCESNAHFNHLYEWVKTQGKCPTCLQEIKLRNLIITSDDSEIDKELNNEE